MGEVSWLVLASHICIYSFWKVFVKMSSCILTFTTYQGTPHLPVVEILAKHFGYVKFANNKNNRWLIPIFEMED